MLVINQTAEQEQHFHPLYIVGTIMQHLLQTGLSLRHPFVPAAPQVHVAGDKDFPEHGLHSGDEPIVLSRRGFHLIADVLMKFPPYLFVDHPERGKYIRHLYLVFA